MFKTIYVKGKINNLYELCSDLQIAGNSNSALFEQGYKKYGKAFFQKPNGLFSVVLYDEKEKTYISARDRFGGEALYYTLLPEKTPVFCDSIKELLKKCDLTPGFREELLEVYLSYSYIPGEDTAYQNVWKPLPGYIYTFKGGNISKERFFTPEYDIDHNKTYEEFTEELSSCLNDIFEEEHPKGALLLSSGIDSNYLFKRLHINEAYTSHYDEEEFSEAETARFTCIKNGTIHHSVYMTPEKFLEVTGKTMEALEQPNADASAPVLYCSLREIAENHSVCYSGEGIDELFMGYYLDDLNNIPDDKTLYNSEYIGSTCVFNEADKKRILKNYSKPKKMEYTEEAYKLSAGNDKFSQAAMVDLLVWMNGNLLPNVYAIGKAAGLTVNTPYLDNRLYDLCLRMPAEYKRTKESTKTVFRSATSPFLDEAATRIKKRGFPVPIRLWMREKGFSEKIKAAFLSDTAKKYFNTDELISMVDKYIENVNDTETWRNIWCVYCFVVWYDRMIAPPKSTPHWQCWDEKYNREIAWPEEEYPYAKLRIMYKGGCLVTAMATLLRHHGIEDEIREELFDPWILNEKLKTNKAFTLAADLELNIFKDLYSLDYVEEIPYSKEKLASLLSENAICLVKVPGHNDKYHFVVPTKAVKDDFEVIDCGADHGLLSEFSKVYTIRTFKIADNKTLSREERFIEKVIRKAFSYIGIKERNHNENDVLFNTDYYERNVTGPEFAWCVVFLWDIFRLCGAGKALCDGNKIEWCAEIYDWGVKTGRIIRPEDIKRGDIVLFDFKKTGAPNHVGIYLAPIGDIYMRTVEGNTREYDDDPCSVVVKRRWVGDIHAVVRPLWEKL